MGVDLQAPDHTTLSRRSQQLDVGLGRIASSRPIHLIVDSTGLSIVGLGEWQQSSTEAAASVFGRSSIQVSIGLVQLSPRF
jgi:hypothetical protein